MTPQQERAERLVALGGNRADGYLVFSSYKTRKALSTMVNR